MLIKVKAFPGSPKREWVKKSEDSFEIKVKALPVKGLANKEIIMVLAGIFNLPEEEIRLIRGFKTRNKIFKI